MTIMCVMCCVCFNWHFTEIKVQRETRSRCKQETNEWSQRLKTDSELFALTSYHHASCLCLMTRARRPSTVPPYRPTSLFILVCLFCLTFFFWSWELRHVWSMWPDQATEGFIKRQNIQETFFFFVLNLFRCVHTVAHSVAIKAFRDFLLSGAAFLCAADPHFSWPPPIIHFRSIPPSVAIHPNTHSSPSPHTPPLWSCHLSAPAQSLLRPTAHLPPAPLTPPNANVHTSTQTHKELRPAPPALMHVWNYTGNL